MKQSNLERRTPLSRGKSSEEDAAKLGFLEEGLAQRCASCGNLRLYRAAHHVVYRQHCPPGTGWDVRNALGVCDDCHERHHNASRRIPLSALTESNLEFAREVLGEAADDYLRRYYGDG